MQGALEVLGGVDCFSGFCSKQIQAWMSTSSSTLFERIFLFKSSWERQKKLDPFVKSKFWKWIWNLAVEIFIILTFVPLMVSSLQHTSRLSLDFVGRLRPFNLQDHWFSSQKSVNCYDCHWRLKWCQSSFSFAISCAWSGLEISTLEHG